MDLLPALSLDLPPPESRSLRTALYSQLRDAIRNGRIASGEQLPASRRLADQIGRSRKSVVAVYERLIAEGLAEARMGAGVYVLPVSTRGDPEEESAPPRWAAVAPSRRSESRTADRPYRFDLRPGVPETAHFPFDIWGRLVGRALRSFSRTSPRYREPAGHPALREAIAGHLAFSRGLSCTADQVIVTTGAQQAVDLIARCLAGTGRRVAIEDPGYPMIREAFSAAGSLVSHVPVDETGLDVMQVPPNTQIVCVTPSHQFPIGVPLSLRRRRVLLELAAKTDAIIVEDDFGGEFRFNNSPAESLFRMDRHGRVFFIGTLSLSMFPALRIGYVVAPRWAISTLTQAREALDWHGPAIEQGALADFIAEGHLARHIRRMRRIYAERRLELLRALQAHCPTLLHPVRGTGGLHLAAMVRGPCDLRAWQQAAAERGVAVDLLDQYASRAPKHRGFALGLGLIPVESIDPAIASLAASTPS
ncbi:MAG TPA: PLP-dependent aminotransferase family protein [Sphingomicrobium sp.]|nr:PLP-dependent aminotransferase family protein [Sphingomicrobium sp.]